MKAHMQVLFAASSFVNMSTGDISTSMFADVIICDQTIFVLTGFKDDISDIYNCYDNGYLVFGL